LLKIIKRLPVAKTALALIFLFVQIGCTLYLPYITADIVNKNVMTGDIASIWPKGGLMIGLSVLSLVGALLNTLFFSKISYYLGAELRADVYGKVLKFSKNEFDKFGVSSLITRTTNDVTQVQTLVEMGLKFLLLAPAYLIGGILLTALLNVRLGLIFLCVVPFLVISYLIINRFANPLYSKMQKTLDSLNRFFREGLTGVKVIRAFGKEDAEYEKYKSANREYTKASISAGTIMSFFIPVITMLISFSALVVVWVSGKGIANGSIAVGDMIGAISYSALILMGFGMLTVVILAVPRGQTSAKRINEVLDTPLSIEDAADPAPAGKELSLTFENVDFRYNGADIQTLSGIDFTVRAGQTLAIIGSTGAGKSSLVNLISRLYDVEKGKISINGADVRDIPQAALRRVVSFAPQTSTLFFGTIRSNLLVGKPGATDEEIWAALDMAQASEFVKTMPNGLDSTVEKAGGNFSGGQKQRLCIARTLLKDADIYVFDDSFSALDFKTDAAVRSSMKAKLKDKISVIVAQRIGTVMNSDLVAVLNKGSLVGLGTHDELKESCSVYKEIIDSQIYKEVA
jgi:ABC-type multidrug transport system fused ATPase/permease subunit